MTEKTILQEVRGFTPVIDVVIQDVGLMSAIVYGRVWRYCQGKNGVCTASLQTIADDLGMSRKTAKRHIKILCAAGYLEDRTPERRNQPHIYADTGKARITSLIAVGGGSESPTRSSEVGQRVPPGGSESPTRWVRESHKDTTEERKRNNNTEPDEEPSKESDPAVVSSLSEEESKAFDALCAIGFVPESTARHYARASPMEAWRWAIYARRQGLGGGFVRKQLDEGCHAPEVEMATPVGEVFR